MHDWRTELMPMQQAHIALRPLRAAPLMAALRFRHGAARRLVQRYRDSRAPGRAPDAPRRGAAQPAAEPPALPTARTAADPAAEKTQP